jgi:hypothetical protein
MELDVLRDFAGSHLLSTFFQWAGDKLIFGSLVRAVTALFFRGIVLSYHSYGRSD